MSNEGWIVVLLVLSCLLLQAGAWHIAGWWLDRKDRRK